MYFMNSKKGKAQVSDFYFFAFYVNKYPLNSFHKKILYVQIFKNLSSYILKDTLSFQGFDYFLKNIILLNFMKNIIMTKIVLKKKIPKNNSFFWLFCCCFL